MLPMEDLHFLMLMAVMFPPSSALFLSLQIPLQSMNAAAYAFPPSHPGVVARTFRNFHFLSGSGNLTSGVLAITDEED